MTRCVILLLVLLLPLSVHAQRQVVQTRLSALQTVPTPPAIPPGSDQVEALTEGAAAPYTGMLLDTDTAIRWTNALRWWPETFRLRMGEVGETIVALEHSHELRIRIVEESYGREVDGLRSDIRIQARQYAVELEDLRHEEFYESWGFAFVVGVLVTVVVAGLGVAGLLAIR